MPQYIVFQGWDCGSPANFAGDVHQADEWKVATYEKEPSIGDLAYTEGFRCHSWVSGLSSCQESGSRCAVVIKKVEKYTPERAKELGLE